MVQQNTYGQECHRESGEGDGCESKSYVIENQQPQKMAIQTLLHADVPPASVMQLSGHKNVQSSNSYSALSIDQQRDLSTILSDHTNSTNLTDDHQNHTLEQQSRQHQPSATDFIDDDEPISLICGQSNSLELQELESAFEPPTSYHLSVKNNQIKISQPPPTGPKYFNFLNATIHGNITININDNAAPAAKRRRIIIDSDSEE